MMRVTRRCCYTPLVLAIQRNASIAEVRQLLANGEDAGHVDRQGQTLLHYAVQQHDNGVLQLFLDLKCAGINDEDRDGYTVLRLACGMSPTDDGDSLTVESIQARLRMLVAAGADINVTDADDCNAMHWAVQDNEEPMAVIETLQSLGVDFHAVDDEGCTVLGKAAEKGHVAVLQKFLDMGDFEIDHQDNLGCSALFWCTKETLSLLIERGANILLKNKDNRDALGHQKQWFASGLVMMGESAADKNAELLAWTKIWTAEVRRRCRAAAEAFAMGNHERLGAESRVRGLEPGVVKMILSFAGKLHEA